MPDSSFIGYVGEADLHDGSILAVEQHNETVRVRIRGASGKVLNVEFNAVHATRANHPEGMLLFAVSEFRSEPPIRRFVFANWDEDGDAYLEVDAENVAVHEE